MSSEHPIVIGAADRDGNVGYEDFTLAEISPHQIATLEVHGSREYQLRVAFSPDGATLAAGSGNTIELWDVATKTNVAILEGHRGLDISVAFSPDGETLASGSGNGAVKLWDVATKTNVATLEEPILEEGVSSAAFNSAVAFSPDGATLAAGSPDDDASATVKLWDVATETNIATFGATGQVSSVAFSSDGAILVSGSMDSTVQLWDVSKWTESPPHSLVESSGDELADSEEDDGEIAFGFSGVVEDQHYTAGEAITALELPEATGGEGEVTYRVSDLPAGLAFDAATRTISGTPEAVTDEAVEITYAAEDSAGEVATLIFSITVNPALSFGDLFDLFGAGGG